MQIKREHAVSTGTCDEVAYELRRDGGTWAGLSILTCVAEIRNDCRYPPPRRTPERIDDDQELHKVIVGGERRRLQHEYIAAAHVFQYLDEDLHVGEPANHRFGQGSGEIGSDGLGERRIRIAGDQLDRSVI